MLDSAAAPTNVKCHHDCTIYALHVAKSPVDFPAPFFSSIGVFSGEYPTDASYHKWSLRITLNLFGSGCVRWSGTFRAWVQFNTTAEIIANIHRDCPSGTISPYGSYVIDSWSTDDPKDSSSSDGCWIIKPTFVEIQSY